MNQKSAQTFAQDPARYLEPPVCKEIFTFIYKLLDEHKVKSVLDVGCANGNFLSFLPDSIRGTGVDISDQFIQIAKKRFQKPNLNFLTLDILAKEAPQRLKDKFDAITMIGVFSTFHDYKALLDRILSFKSKFVMIHSPLNDFPVDASHFHRDLTRSQADFQCAYNIFSRVTLDQYFKEHGVRYRCIPFEMNATLKKDAKNPIHNFHITLDNGERYLTNGIGILFKEYVIVIEQ